MDYNDWYVNLTNQKQIELQDEFEFDDWYELTATQKAFIYGETAGDELEEYKPEGRDE